MAYLGLVPSKHSSGATIRKGGITKAGNALARRVLIEGAWTYNLDKFLLEAVMVVSGACARPSGGEQLWQFGKFECSHVERELRADRLEGTQHRLGDLAYCLAPAEGLLDLFASAGSRRNRVACRAPIDDPLISTHASSFLRTNFVG